MISKKAINAAWYYIQENTEGRIITQLDAARKFGITEVTVRKAIKKIKDELGIKGVIFAN